MVSYTEGVKMRGLSAEMENYRKVPNGATFFQMDTNKTFMYSAETDMWHNVTPGYDPATDESKEIRLAVSPIIPEGVDMWGKTVDDLQKDIKIGANTITGILKYVADYSTAFPGALSRGNYIALRFDTPGLTGVTITVQLTDPVALDSDQTVVLRIRDKDTQTITVTASKDNYTTLTRVYSLSGLILETK